MVCTGSTAVFSDNRSDDITSDNTISSYETLDSFFTLYQPYLTQISAYQPMYFLVGTRPEKSKFQFSFKYRFFNTNDPLSQKAPWITRILFAYTQTSFWDLKSDSMPFEDTSYKPECFYLTSNLTKSRDLWAGTFIQAGAQHESNGQSADMSRSTNYLYVQPVLIFFHEKSGYGLQISPKVWTYFRNEDETNPDLNDYRGYFDIQLKFGKADNVVVDTHLWSARKGSSFQCDVTYPMSRHIKTNINLYLHAQYANRLAESLLSYTERSKAFRIGCSIVR